MLSRLNSFFRQPGFQRYLKNTSWLLAGQAARMGLGLVLSLAIARHLGPQDFGLFHFVLALVALVGVGARLGLDDVVRREFIQNPAHEGELFGAAFVLTAGMSTAVFAAMLLASHWMVGNSLTFLLFCILGASMLLYPLRFIDLWFQARTRGDLSFKSTVPVLLGFALVKLVALLWQAPLIVFCWIYLVELLAVALLQMLIYNTKFNGLRTWRFDAGRARNLICEAWPLIFASLAVTNYMQVDLVMLGIFRDNAEVGEYTAATNECSLTRLRTDDGTHGATFVELPIADIEETKACWPVRQLVCRSSERLGGSHSVGGTPSAPILHRLILLLS